MKPLALLSLAILGSCQLQLPGLRGSEWVNLKPEERAQSAGPQPSPKAAQVVADLYLREGLKDYDSAKIQWWARTCAWQRGSSTIPGPRMCAPTTRLPEVERNRTVGQPLPDEQS